MKKTTSIISTILLICLFCFGTYTVVNTNNISNDKTQNSGTQTTVTTTQPQPVFDYTPLSISDGRLAYYSAKPSGLQDEKHISEKPEYSVNDFGKTKSLTVRLTKDNINWGPDTEKNNNDAAFTARNLTGQNFKDIQKNYDTIFITDYAYNTAFEPCKQIITEYIKQTGNDVLYRINLEYDSESSGEKLIPKWINIQACSDDDEKTFDFSFFIFNYDENRIADRATGEWDID